MTFSRRIILLAADQAAHLRMVKRYFQPAGGNMHRRGFLQGLGGTIAAPAILSHRVFAAERAPLTFGLPQGDYDTAVLEALPGKIPLIKLTTRPPNFETPASYFGPPIKPNDAFFVRS